MHISPACVPISVLTVLKCVKLPLECLSIEIDCISNFFFHYAGEKLMKENNICLLIVNPNYISNIGNVQ